MKGNRVWLYCRAASGADSAEAQKDRLEAYALEHRLEIAGCSSDVGDGWPSDRPGLREFHAAMEEKKVDLLLLLSLSSLGRESEEVARYWQSLRAHGVRLCTVAEGEVYLDMKALFVEMFAK